MAEQVIIEFVADTAKLEEAYNKVNEQVIASTGLNKDSAAAFQKANADAAQSFDNVVDASKKLSEQLRNLNSIVAGGVLKSIVADLNAIGKAQTDVSASAKNLGNLINTLKMFAATGKSIAEAGKGIGGSFEAATGTLAVFGLKNEELEKALIKLQAAMQAINGLQEVSTALKSEYIIVTEAATAAEGFFAEASAAAWAAATGGITLLVGAIVDLIFYINSATKASRAQKEEYELLNTELEDLAENTKTISRINKGLGFDDLGNQLDGVGKLAKKAQEGMEKIAGTLKNFGNLSGAQMRNLLLVYGKEAGPAYDNLTSEQKKLFDKLWDISKTAYDKQADLQADAAKAKLDLESDYTKQKIELDKNGFDRQLAQFDNETKIQKAALLDRMKSLGVFKADQDKYLNELDGTRAKERNELVVNQAQERQKQLLQTLIQGDEVKRAYVIKGREDDIKLLDDIDKKQLQLAALSNKKLNDVNSEDYKVFTAQQKLNRQQYLASIAADENKSYTEAIGHLRTNREAQLKIQTDYNLSEQQVDKMFEEERAANDTETDSQVYASITNRLKLQADADKKATDQLSKNHETQEALKKQFHLDDAKLDEMFEKERNANPNATDEQVYTAITAKLKPEEDAAQAKIKLAADTEKQIAQLSINFAKQAADQIFAVTNQNRNQRFNDEVNMLQKQKDFELNNNNLTQAQKLAIQRKFDKEVAAVKLQQWRADQKAKEEQAIINGALAITNALATAPTILAGLPLAAMAAATAAVQVATIAAQKPPQFAKGTPTGSPNTPAGTKLVGEHGPELIYTPGGERIITAPDTAAILAKYDVPALPNLSPQLMLKANAPYAAPLINEKSLARHLATEMAKQTRPIIQFDKNGFTTHLISKGSKTTLVNNKYAL